MCCFKPCCCCCCCCNNCPEPLTFTLSGVVTNAAGAIANLPIQFTVNGLVFNTLTNAQGMYSLSVKKGSHVVIMPVLGVGVTSTPAEYTLDNIQADATGLNFFISPLV